MPHRKPLLALCAVLLAACSDAARGPVAPLGTGSPSLAIRMVDHFDTFDASRWSAQSHPLGRGMLEAHNVSVGRGLASLTLPAGAYDGAEIRSARTYRYGTFAARLRAPLAPGSLSALFLYQGQPGDANDEIDIELYNDGSRRVMLTTWVAGEQTNSVTVPLPFDPAAAFHHYQIEWSANRVRFVVDGRALHEFTRGVPRNAMYVYSNTWWPVWLSGPLLGAPARLLLDWIRIAS